ncbi:MAG: MBL fold metallo-hydrolase [Alkalibacterium sp.]|nr:MBL fold metallo-hydrolase [Alkalibacterium sp.]
MTTTRFWSGLDTIGGNIVEIKTDKARVICDFGLAVADNTTNPLNSDSELENAILANMLPAIPELYDTKGFKVLSLNTLSESSIDTAVFISHLHLDHMGGLRFLPEEITVYMDKESYKLYQILIKVNEDLPVSCKVKPLSAGQQVEIGDIIVTPHLSDHDAKGTCALFIETPDLKIIHSGDFRLNGQHPERVFDWAEKANKWEADVLLIEGTTYSFDESEEIEEESAEPADKVVYTESTLLSALKELLEEDKEQLIAFNPYIRNVERLKQIDEVVLQSRRTMVWEEAYAAVLDEFYPGYKWTVLEDTCSGSSGLESSADYVSIETIRQDPENFVLQNSLKNIDFLKGFGEGLYLHSNGEPLGDYDPRYQILLDFLEDEGLTFIPFGASGHATKEDLLKVAKTVSAELTVPWHTFSPEAFYDALVDEGLSSFLPEYNQTYSFPNLIRQHS